MTSCDPQVAFTLAGVLITSGCKLSSSLCEFTELESRLGTVTLDREVNLMPGIKSRLEHCVIMCVNQ